MRLNNKEEHRCGEVEGVEPSPLKEAPKLFATHKLYSSIVAAKHIPYLKKNVCPIRLVYKSHPQFFTAVAYSGHS